MSLQQILAPIAADMKQVDSIIRRRLSSEVALINEIGNYIIMAGGKRMRPALVILAARALNTGQPERAQLLAAVVEFIHTATLLHDDVVDHSDLRRGRKTANAVWGNEGAVLSGDFLYSRSFQMMVDAELPAVMRIMADTTNAIAEGEVLQLLNCGNPDIDEAAYTRVIELKTAVLFEAAAKVGAIAAGADETALNAMGRYGHELGMAFQLIDDVLDFESDPEQTGKALGNDLAEGKPTLPLILAMKSGTSQEAGLISEALRNGDAARIEEIVSLIHRSGALNQTRERAAAHSRAAMEALHDLPPSEFKRALASVAEFSTQRIA